ncbi:MAG: hypothetical protein JO019_01865 [Candidatus Kaiserbacteria bacterium]|nr:hypothetical protein [Candidatus Kaiserbacteria bacterium]
MATAAHDRISPTALVALYFRAMAGLPYARELAEASGAEAAFKRIVGDKVDRVRWMAPLLKAREMATDVLLARWDCPNIVEFATGLSQRPFTWTEDPRLHYFATDLPNALDDNKRIIESLGLARPNLVWQALNVVSEGDFAALDLILPPGWIAWVCDGLIPYLTLEEQERMGSLIRARQKKRGGVWITADLTSRQRLRAFQKIDPDLRDIMQSIAGLTGRDFEANVPETIDEMEARYSKIGFSNIIRHEVGELVTLSSLETDEPEKLEAMLKNMNIWEIS